MPPKKFKNANEIVEAIQWDGKDETISEIITLTDFTITKVTNSTKIIIFYPQGKTLLHLQDWVIKSKENGVGIVSPQAFDTFYEEIK